ncbi:hypothetical protein J6590_073280 [Homalodisca vitripennis]|nr:hypothetical protein J6590_073280 [Homalodisca vitripennis]
MLHLISHSNKINRLQRNQRRSKYLSSHVQEGPFEWWGVGQASRLFYQLCESCLAVLFTLQLLTYSIRSLRFGVRLAAKLQWPGQVIEQTGEYRAVVGILGEDSIQRRRGIYLTLRELKSPVVLPSPESKECLYRNEDMAEYDMLDSEIPLHVMNEDMAEYDMLDSEIPLHVMCCGDFISIKCVCAGMRTWQSMICWTARFRCTSCVVVTSYP